MASAAEQLAANLSMSNLGKAKELRQRIVFTLLALLVFRLGIAIPVPGIDIAAFSQLFSNVTTEGGLGFLSQINRFTGGALGSGSIFTLSIIPYISASIIVTLLRAMIPSWDAMHKEGESGRRQLNQYTRYLTLVLAMVQSFGISVGLEAGALLGNVLVPEAGGWAFRLSAMLSMTGGTMFLLWLGEQISARGVGNGISLIIYIGIISGLPAALGDALANTNDAAQLARSLLTLLVIIGLVLLVVFVERCVRKVPVQYPSRVQGNKQMAANNQFLPLKINTAGVIPAIFASSLLFLPTTVLAFNQGSANTWVTTILAYLQPGTWLFTALFGLLIIFFAFFYTSIVFNPEDTAENMKKAGGSIPGIRPGSQTAAYLDFILSRLTVVGGLYLAFVALAPMIAADPSAAGQAFFGGTAILIVVTVTIDLVSQVQSYLVANQYEAILQKQNLRGGPMAAALGGNEDDDAPKRQGTTRKRKPRKSNSR